MFESIITFDSDSVCLVWYRTCVYVSVAIMIVYLGYRLRVKNNASTFPKARGSYSIAVGSN